jgi:hypothetical protein
MGEHHVSVIEGLVQRVEDRVAEWRRHAAALKAEADASREELWAEATERERLLAATMNQEKGHLTSPEGDTATHQVVFVVASDAFADALQNFSPQRDRLLSVVPAREGGGGMGLRGSWLVLEKG